MSTVSANTTETPRRNYLKGAFRWARRLATAAILSSALGYVGLIVLGYEPMTIVTGSMQETIPVGSLVVSHPVAPDTLEVGDVISFQKPIGAPGLDTHRIVSIKSEGGKRFYQTKGDSNPVVDPWVLSFDAIEAHKMAFHVPYVGNALLFARSSVGRILLIGYVCFTLLFSILKGVALAAKQKEEAAALAVPSSSDGETPPRPSQAGEAAAADPVELPEHVALSPRPAAPRVAPTSHRPLAHVTVAVTGILLVAIWYRSRRRAG